MTCSYCLNISVISTTFENVTEHWCHEHWEKYGGWECSTCFLPLPIDAFGSFDYDDCISCRNAVSKEEV